MFDELIEFFFPPQCAACDGIGSGLCERCAPFDALPMFRQLRTLEVRALGEYHGAYRRAVLALKDGRRDVAAALACRLEKFVARDAVLVPVATTPSRCRVRGMDNVEELARLTASRGHAATLSALQCTRRDAQRGRSRAARLAARGRFACDAELVKSRTVVLVDDVCTTGATLEDCAATIRAAGGRVEEAVVVALA